MRIIPVTVEPGESEPFVPAGARPVTAGSQPHSYRSLVSQVLPPHLSVDQRFQVRYELAADVVEQLYIDTNGVVYIQKAWKFTPSVSGGHSKYSVYLVEWKRQGSAEEPLLQLVAVIHAQARDEEDVAFDLLRHAADSWQQVLPERVVEYLPVLVERLKGLI